MPEDFDFHSWSELAASNPAAFEEARRQALEAVIATGTNQERLRRLQWRADGKRRRARTPLKACLVLSGMMWDAFADMRDALDVLLETREKPRGGPRPVPGVNEPAPDRRPTRVDPCRRHAGAGEAGRVCPLHAAAAERQGHGGIRPPSARDGDTPPRGGGAP